MEHEVEILQKLVHGDEDATRALAALLDERDRLLRRIDELMQARTDATAEAWALRPRMG